MLIFPYQWHEDKCIDDQTLLRVYGLNEKNQTICLKVNGFCPYIYIELPQKDIKNDKITWDESFINQVYNKFKYACGNTYEKIDGDGFHKKYKLYYANVNHKNYKRRKFPFIKMSFVNKKFIYFFKSKLKNPFSIGGTEIQFKVHESNATPVLQLCCNKDIPITGWIEFAGKKVKKSEKETLCNYEYNVSWRNLMKSEYDKMPQPVILSFDIEVNSTNPNKMPSANIPGDKVFQISCVICKQGQNYNEKFLLTLGNPLQATVGENVKIFNYKTERELIIGYKDFLNAYNPNIIIGYNILGFDIKYMIDRTEYSGEYPYLDEFDEQGFRINHHCSVKNTSWSSSAYKNQDFTYLDTEGRLHIDLLPLIRRDYKFNNYKLKTVSEFFLGETKDPLTPKGIFKCYRMGMKGGEEGNKAMGIVGKYCVQDSVPVYFMKLSSLK